MKEKLMMQKKIKRTIETYLLLVIIPLVFCIGWGIWMVEGDFSWGWQIALFICGLAIAANYLLAVYCYFCLTQPSDEQSAPHHS